MTIYLDKGKVSKILFFNKTHRSFASYKRTAGNRFIACKLLLV